MSVGGRSPAERGVGPRGAGGEGGRLEGGSGTPVERIAFLGLVGLSLAWAAWEARTFPPRARIFPQTVALAGLALTLAAVLRELVAARRTEPRDGSPPRPFLRHLRAAAPYLGWIGAYYLGIWLVGFPAASGLFVFLFLLRVAGLPRTRAVGAAVAVVAVLLALAMVLNLAWPEAVLVRWLGGPG